MLADATVYGIGLYAVGRATSIKLRAASISGIFQIVLALGVMAEIVRRLIWGSEPEALFMIGVSIVALIANVVCLALISKHRDGEVHMRASWIFSKNDVIANSGVILAGVHLPLSGGAQLVVERPMSRSNPGHRTRDQEPRRRDFGFILTAPSTRLWLPLASTPINTPG